MTPRMRLQPEAVGQGMTSQRVRDRLVERLREGSTTGQGITDEHVQNNLSVRGMLGQRGIQPEHLPAEEDIKKLERRVKSDEKKLEKRSGKLPGKKAD